jgi:hypothetical protein
LLELSNMDRIPEFFNSIGAKKGSDEDEDDFEKNR